MTSLVEGYCGDGTTHAPHDHPAMRLRCIGHGPAIPPVDPRQAVRTCCGDTHWGPEPIDYPCPEALCPHGFYSEACGDCHDVLAASDSHASVSPEQTPSPAAESAHRGDHLTVGETS